MITIDKLKKNFGEKIAVDIEHYEINQGDMLGLVGNNGAGKTTLFRLMLDLLKADNGKVVINDIDVSLNEDWKAFTGAFIDSGFLIDYLTPEEYFYFIGKMYGLKKEEVDERLVPFERFMNGEVMGQKKLIRNYSAGNKQKIGIISAMLHYPQLLILDEPFNFLDPSSQSVIKHLLKKYNEEHNATVIISSHNLNHTVDVCPRIALLEHGVIIRDIQNENNSAEKELEEIFIRTYGKVERKGGLTPKTYESEYAKKQRKKEEAMQEYLLVDGYNVIFAWQELKELAKVSIEAARDKLMDILCNYQGYKKCVLILVFDAYKVEGYALEIQKYHNIHVVYTKEAETADQYIEKVVHHIGRKYHVTVVTSDAPGN